MKQNAVEIITAAGGGIAVFLFGAWDAPLIALLVFITLDYITGVMCGVVKHEVSSEIGAKGLFKKAMIMVVIIAAVFLDRLMGTEWVVRSAACFFYIANEGISILENAAILGVPAPKQILRVLAQFREKSGDKDENKDKGGNNGNGE